LKLLSVGFALAAVCAPASHAQSVKQFSIACPTSVPPGSTQVFQIDLDRRLWCQNACVVTQPITVAAENELRLAGAHTPGKTTDVSTNVYRVDRVNGKVFVESFGYETAIYTNCSRGPYGGIPGNRF
jgi:hypothetical protein